MTKRSRGLAAPLTALLMALAPLLGACSDNSPTNPGTSQNVGKTSAITVLHALSDAPGPVSFTVGDSTVIADTLPYGVPRRVQAQIGSDVALTVRSTAGQSVGSTHTPVDAAKITWVIFTGLTFGDPARELISVTTGRPSIPAGRALIRMINASPNVGAVDLRLGDVAGARVGTSQAFKQTGEFTSVDTTLRQLVVTASDGGSQLLTVPIVPTAGKLYTVVLFGSRLVPSGDYALRAQVVEEP